jgi:hypothetical protein
VITYRGHIVYVVANKYPTIGKVTEVIAAATVMDLRHANLGVLRDGHCFPLSEHECAELMKCRPTIATCPSWSVAQHARVS